jgi:SecD/SecF fusion protein
MIGVASGAYSSIFIASPVLTHWKERESVYRHRHDRILAEHGSVPAYASVGSDIDPARDRTRRRTGRLTTPEAENVSAAEFEQMKRDLPLEDDRAGRGTSSPTRRPSTAPRGQTPSRGQRTTRGPAPSRGPAPAATPVTPPAPATPAPDAGNGGGNGFQRAPDEAENDGMTPQAPKPNRPAKKSRNKRHGRPR